MYQVHKRDGRIVDFDINKVVNGITKAGATLAEAEAIAAKVESWLPEVTAEDVIKASEIREKVLTELRLINPTVASNFESYQKS